MAEKSGGSGGLILIGFAAVAIIIALALKQRKQQAISTQAQMPADLVTLLKPHIESAVESAMKKSIQYMADGAVKAVFAPSSSGGGAAPVSTFKNNEKRIVTRDADGFITSVETIRNAQKVSDNNAA